MALYLVTIEGDAARAAGLLAKAGVQSTHYREGSVAARLHADDAANARQRVAYALGDESFGIGKIYEEGY